jgi:hypothetical protein
MESKVRYATQGCKCRVCKKWLEKGERKANQFLCCNKDSRILTTCQKKHRQVKARQDKDLRDKGLSKTLVCDQCKKTIPRTDLHQKRCVSGTKGILSPCQKKAIKDHGAKHYKEVTVRKHKSVCLRCGKKFSSDGKYHRICDPCTAINSRISVKEHKSVTHSNYKNMNIA